MFSCYNIGMLKNYQRHMIDNNVTLQLGMQVVIVLDENAVYAPTEELKERFREIRRHQTLNRNANVLTKSEILRNAPR